MSGKKDGRVDFQNLPTSLPDGHSSACLRTHALAEQTGSTPGSTSPHACLSGI